MIKYITALKDDMELLIQSRLEVLREVNNLPSDYIFGDDFIAKSKAFFEKADQTTVLAFDETDTVIGCATMCYIEVMPTFSHPTGKRAHLMNVYTNRQYRRQGIAMHMIKILIEETKKRGVTEISLDATESGRLLYKKCGFIESDECMVLSVNN